LIFFVFQPKMRQTSMLYFVSNETGNAKESLKFVKSESSSFLVDSQQHSKPRSRTVGSLNCDEDQMILDAGQKEFGNKYCTVCGMHYNPDNGNDFLSHEKYHRQIVKPTFIMNKSQERMVAKIVQFPDSFIGKVNLCKGESAVKSWIARIVQFACNEIGSSFDELFSKEYKYQLYIFVNEGRRLEIAGLLLVEHQHTAFPRVQFMIEERERCRVLMGVVMIWIAPSCRRKKIATRLLDFARNNFLLGDQDWLFVGIDWKREVFIFLILIQLSTFAFLLCYLCCYSILMFVIANISSLVHGCVNQQHECSRRS
ncbi:N-acetyltransferase ESCO2, partial [Trichinella spiralis]